MLLAALLFFAGSAGHASCSLMRPVAPDEASARRIAEAVIRNVPASARARAAQEAGEPYELIVEADPGNPNQWIAFEHPRDKQDETGGVTVTIAGHGLGFRVNRCTGAISGMHYQR